MIHILLEKGIPCHPIPVDREFFGIADYENEFESKRFPIQVQFPDGFMHEFTVGNYFEPINVKKEIHSIKNIPAKEQQLFSGEEELHDYLCFYEQKIARESTSTLKIVPKDIKQYQLSRWFGLQTENIHSVAELPTGQLCASSADGKVSIWDLTATKPTRILTCADESAIVFALEVLPNGDLLTATSDGVMKSWDTNRGVCINAWKAHEAGENGKVLALLLSETLLATTGFDGFTRPLCASREYTCLQGAVPHDNHPIGSTNCDISIG